MTTLDFKDTILQLAEKINKLRDNIGTEEATKNAFVMPMLNALGYDVFNPLEVLPEFTCDIGTKKGEKIDYAILKDGNPIMLLEAKHWKQELTLYDNQLLRYFHVSTARFGVLTNGIIYRFYTDIDKENVMDEKPFLEIDLENLTDIKIEQLKKFHKSYFNESDILSTANELKLTIAVKNIVKREFSEPSDEFTRYFVKETNEGHYTSKLVETYKSILKKCIQNYINDIISDRLNIAIENSKETNDMKEKLENSEEMQEGASSTSEDTGIVTLQEELDAYNIVRSILRKYVDVSRITYTDYKSYFVISLVNSSWYWICRINVMKTMIQIGFPEKDYKGCKWIKIENIDTIFNLEKELADSLNQSLSLIDKKVKTV